jgi:hypothetical protein
MVHPNNKITFRRATLKGHILVNPRMPVIIKATDKIIFINHNRGHIGFKHHSRCGDWRANAARKPKADGKHGDDLKSAEGDAERAWASRRLVGFNLICSHCNSYVYFVVNCVLELLSTHPFQQKNPRSVTENVKVAEDGMST